MGSGQCQMRRHQWRPQCRHRVGFIICGLVALAWTAGARGDVGSGAVFLGLGDMPGGNYNTTAYSVSADGSTVVGQGSSAPGGQAFRWTQAGGLQGLGDFPGGTFNSFATGVSADGSVVCGGIPSGVAGLSAYRWTSAGGLQNLGQLHANSTYTEPTALSADGSVMVGYDYSGVGTEAFRWTAAGGYQALGDLAGGDFRSEAVNVSANGQVIVGKATNATGTRAARWTALEGFQLLGGETNSIAASASGDGSTIVGTSDFHAFIWEAAHGMRDLRTVLINEYGLGAELASWNLATAAAISPDGMVITGTGDNFSGREAWVVYLPEPTGAALPLAAMFLLSRRRASRRPLTEP